jgi:hypothetical protein
MVRGSGGGEERWGLREELQQVRGEAREDGLGAAGAGPWEGEDEGVGAGAPGCGWAGAGGCDLVRC